MRWTLLCVFFLLGALQAWPQGAAPVPRATVVIDQEDVLPVRVDWECSGKKGSLTGKGGDVPADGKPITLQIRPYHFIDYDSGTAQTHYQFGLWLKNQQVMKGGAGPFQIVTTLEKGDEIRVQALPPSAPWRGAMTRIDGVLIHVYVRDFSFWGSLGSKAVAEDLAKHVVEVRGKDAEHWGKFEGSKGLILFCPSDGKSVPPELLKVSERRIAECAAEMLGVIRRQRPATGPGVAEILKKYNVR